MNTRERARTALDRNIKALRMRPSIGQGTAVTKVRVRDGYTCDVEEGSWKFVVDMHQKSGGENLGPNPGIYGRAALGSCVAICYQMWGAKFDVPMEVREVEVQADYDARSDYGVDDIPAGYAEIRLVVTIATREPEARIIDLLNDADLHSAYLVIFSAGQTVKREVRIVPPEE